jgi:hypothetical protein
MVMQEKNRFYTSGEQATMLRVRRKTIDSYRTKGLIPATRIGLQWLYEASAIDAALARQTAQGDRQAERTRG